MIAYFRNLSLLPLLLLSAACVTINIYFPAAAAEEAARVIVRDVLGAQENGAAPDGKAVPEAETEQPGASSRHQLFAMAMLNVFISPAQAQADINIRTPAIDSIRASMRSRSPKLAPFYANGAVGFTQDALVAIRAMDAIPLQDRAKVQKLVADENSDRNALYREIARANGHPEWEPNIRSTFARVWVEEARPGTWYQDSSGAWQQK